MNNQENPLPLKQDRSNSVQSRLTNEQFLSLANIPPEVEWFANIRNANSKRAYKNDIKDFSQFVGISKPEEFRLMIDIYLKGIGKFKGKFFTN